MSLFKRGKTWWVRFTSPSGERIRCSAGTDKKQKAQEFHDQLKAKLWQVHKLGDKPKRTWQEAVVRWLKETDHKRSHDKDIQILKWLDTYLSDRFLDDINRELIDSIAQIRLEDTSRSNVNRYLSLIRAILRRSRDEWEWVDKIPKVRLFSCDTKRVRWITHAEAKRLITFLTPHHTAMVQFSLATGLRQRNVSFLEWSQVDLTRKIAWIHPDQSKNKRAISVPLNSQALEVLERQKGQNQRYVFTYNGKPVYQVNSKAWRNALVKAGIENFRWHDLRHTWASWHVQSGTPLNVLQELGGWESYEMVQRYAHLAAEHLIDYAENVVPNGTKLAH